jgi:hypothetical protein
MTPMKSASLLLLLATGFICSVIAGETQIKVTSDTLSEWKANGVEVAAKGETPALTLPVGTEISRVFSRGMVAVHLVSRPYFARDNSGWPILIVGPAALVFKREGDVGQLVLTSLGGKLQVVSESLSLDAAGSPRESLDVMLAYDPASGTGFVGIGNELRSFQSDYSVPMEVILSAGNDKPWQLDRVEVDLLDQEQGQVRSVNPDASVPKAGVEMTSSTNPSATVERFLDRQNIKEAPLPLPESVSSSVENEKASAPALEIFTPPSVRFMSADTVRALLAKSLRK